MNGAHFLLGLHADDDMLRYAGVMGAATGIFPALEGAACLAAQIRLLDDGWLKPDETVVLFNTGSGLKYAHLWQEDDRPGIAAAQP